MNEPVTIEDVDWINEYTTSSERARMYGRDKRALAVKAKHVRAGILPGWFPAPDGEYAVTCPRDVLRGMSGMHRNDCPFNGVITIAIQRGWQGAIFVGTFPIASHVRSRAEYMPAKHYSGDAYYAFPCPPHLCDDQDGMWVMYELSYGSIRRGAIVPRATADRYFDIPLG